MPAPPPHLFHPDTAGSYRRAMGAAVDHLVDHLAGTAGRPLTGATPREFRKGLISRNEDPAK